MENPLYSFASEILHNDPDIILNREHSSAVLVHTTIPTQRWKLFPQTTSNLWFNLEELRNISFLFIHIYRIYCNNSSLHSNHRQFPACLTSLAVTKKMRCEPGKLKWIFTAIKTTSFKFQHFIQGFFCWNAIGKAIDQRIGQPILFRYSSNNSIHSAANSNGGIWEGNCVCVIKKLLKIEFFYDEFFCKSNNRLLLIKYTLILWLLCCSCALVQ